MKTLKILGIALLTVLVMSCDGDKGDPGPTGPQGLQGPQGEPVNVKSFTFLNKTLASAKFNLAVPAITQSVLDKGMVLGYLRNSGDNSWFTLPFAQGSSFVTLYSISLGQVSVDTNFNSGGAVDIRIVVIEGSSNTNGRKASIDYSDYNAVKAFYNLED